MSPFTNTDTEGMWKNCPHWLHIKPKILTAQSFIFSASSLHQIKKILPPLTLRFLLTVVISGSHEASTQFAISLHFSLALPVSSVYLTSLYRCWIHRYGMFSPLHFHFTQTNSLDFFLLACHAFQKSALTSKDNSPWSSAGSGARGQKTSPADCAQ